MKKEGKLIRVQDINPMGLEALRFAIVKQAILDYDNALKWLRKHPEGVGYTYASSRNSRLHTKMECEKFFRGQWYAMLCDIDGDSMLKMIRKKFYNRPIRWHKPAPYKRRRLPD